MEIRSFWGNNIDYAVASQTTENIDNIMEQQCNYLYEITNGKVFAVFGEIKLDGSMITVVQALANAVKNVSGITGIQETIADSSTKELIDAKDMYYTKRYGFEICTDKYRFRLFEIIISPIYPVDIIIDEGICNNIEDKLIDITIHTEKFNQFKIGNEEMFCSVLQLILQDKKVHYILHKLKSSVDTMKTSIQELPKKIIICEGRTDEAILAAIANKINVPVAIIVAEGKYKVPTVFNTVIRKNDYSKILIVVDSDSDEAGTRDAITKQITDYSYELVIINNKIEDWFPIEIANYSKLRLMQSINHIIEDMDFNDLSQKDISFNQVVNFLQS